MIKDLEPLLDAILDDENYDAESAIMRFGHGDCHLLTWALHSTYNLPILVIYGDSSGLDVHSCVLLNETTTLDGYGINTIERTMERYGKLASVNRKEGVLTKPTSPDFLKSFAAKSKETTEQILKEFEPIVELLDIDLNSLLKK